MRQPNIKTVLRAGAATLAFASLGGCGSSPFGSSSPFGNANVSDRTFIGAAQTWDLDKNGVVTCEEWKTYSSGALREADGNGDGALTADEYATMARSDRLFEIADLKYFDANSDGKVTVEELSGKPNQAFKLLDKNGDCQIARDESVQVTGIDKVKDKSRDSQDQTVPKPGR